MSITTTINIVALMFFFGALVLGVSLVEDKRSAKKQTVVGICGIVALISVFVVAFNLLYTLCKYIF